jgi:hypothetical protein
MLLKIELDWNNSDIGKNSTLCLFANVLECQVLANDSNSRRSYRIDVDCFLLNNDFLDVKLAYVTSRNNVEIEFQDQDLEILNVPIASCEVVESFPVPDFSPIK